MKTSPAKQPEASKSFDVGWKATAQGVRVWPRKECSNFPFETLKTWTQWSPFVDANNCPFGLTIVKNVDLDPLGNLSCYNEWNMLLLKKNKANNWIAKAYRMAKLRPQKSVFRYHLKKFVAFWAFCKIFSGEQRAVDVMVHDFWRLKFKLETQAIKPVFLLHWLQHVPPLMQLRSNSKNFSNHGIKDSTFNLQWLWNILLVN